MVTVLMVGTGGYGGYYLNEILNAERGKSLKLVGAVDPYAASGKYYEELKARNVPIYNTLEEFYAEHTADMAVIATPTYLHAKYSNYCMEHGSDVLCEKPISATLEDAASMIDSRDKTGRKLAIGFQWSHCEPILQLKKDVLAGRYGAIKQFKTLVFFPRNMEYYRRGSGWAARRSLPSGEMVLDSVASNATAHYLHNMLFVTGPEMALSAEPLTMESEIYRANPIEMFDTATLRIQTKAGTQLLFYVTHAVPFNQERNPEFVMVGEKGRVILEQIDGKAVMTGFLNDGTQVDYGNPAEDSIKKLYTMAEAVEGKTALPCTPETAVPHLKCIAALAESYPDTPDFDRAYIKYIEEDKQNVCEGLGEVLLQCYKECKLPYELGVQWAIKPHVMEF